MSAPRTWSAEEKLQIVLEGRAPRANVSGVCRHHGMRSTAYYEGKAKSLTGRKLGLKTASGGAETALRHENARLKKLVAEYALINDRLQETLEGQSLGRNDRGGSGGASRTRERSAPPRWPVRSTWPGPPSPTNLDPSPSASPREKSRARGHVRRVALTPPSFGYRRVWSVLRCEEGVFIHRKRVRRILTEVGMQTEVLFPRPRFPETGNLSALGPDRRWYAGLTYVDTTDLGPVPLMVVMDVCRREVVGHELLRWCGAAEALSVVERAFLARFPKTGRTPGLTLKTDGGTLFAAHHFQDGCRTMGVPSMATRKRRSEDNGRMGSWNGPFEPDSLRVREATSFLETRRIVDAGVVGDNPQRPHSSLDDLTPSDSTERKVEGQRTRARGATERGGIPLLRPLPRMYRTAGGPSLGHLRKVS